MSVSNYTELQAATLNWLSRTGDTKLTTLAPDFILFAEASLNRVLRTRQMETSATLTPTNGVASLPTDYISMRRAYINTSVPVELEYMPPEQFYLKYPINAGGSKYFTIEGETMVLADRGSTTINILYYQKIPDLATNSTNWLLTAHPDLYLSATLAQAYDVIKKEELAQKWTAKSSMLISMITSSDKEGKYSGSALRVIAS